MLSKKAASYISLVIFMGVAACASPMLVSGWGAQPGESLSMLAMTGLAIISILGKAVYMSGRDASKGTSWYTPLLSIMFAGAMILSPQSIVVVVVAPHLVEWLIERLRKTPFLSKWYIQPFNVATHLLCSLAAWGAFAATRNLVALPVAGVAAALVYLVVNHVLVGQVMVFACGMTWAQTGVWEINNLLCDGAFLAAGLGTAALVANGLALAIPLVVALLIGQRMVARTLVRKPAAVQPA